MANFNKIMLMGNITRDIEVRYTQGGAAVASTCMAINERYRTAQGEDREETCFVDLVVWGKQAETLKQYVKKGDPLFVEGRLKLESWQDKATGANRSKHSVTVNNFQFMPRTGQPAQGGGNYAQAQGGHGQQAGGAPQQGYAQQSGGYQPPPQMPPAPSFGAPQQSAPASYNQAAAPAPSFGHTQAQAPQSTMPTAPTFVPVNEPEDDIPF